MREKYRTIIFLGIWLGSWLIFVDNKIEIAIFLICNLILWAIIELSFMFLDVVKTFKELVRLSKKEE